jgi:phospholipid/cholesterol/gamma-HCH transport system substrate-binding protein
VRKRSRRVPLLLGIAFVLLMIGAVILIFELFGGAFSDYAVVDVQLPASSTAVALGAPVEYRNVTVGHVSSDGRSVPGGLIVIQVHIIPSMLSDIPADVEATETPVSFFGDPYVVLQPPPHPSTASLQAGATIPALKVGPTASLQATLGDLDKLLVNLHPAELDAALTAVAGALQGQGLSLGKNLDAGNAYLSKMLPLWPTLVADLKTLVPISNQFAASTPDILSILANQAVTGRTIESDAKSVRGAISGGASLASETDKLLVAIQQPFNVLAADSGPFLQDISQNPNEIAQLLQGLDQWANAWTAAESSGPYLKLTTTVSVANPADLGLAVIGGPEIAHYIAGGLGPGFVNPSTYTSAGTISASTSASLTAAALERAVSSAPSPVMAEPAQTNAVSRIFSALSGRRPASPGVATLLLSPLLTSLVTHG